MIIWILFIVVVFVAVVSSMMHENKKEAFYQENKGPLECEVRKKCNDWGFITEIISKANPQPDGSVKSDMSFVCCRHNIMSQLCVGNTCLKENDLATLKELALAPKAVAKAI
jgi:hypothetical protein